MNTTDKVYISEKRLLTDYLAHLRSRMLDSIISFAIEEDYVALLKEETLEDRDLWLHTKDIVDKIIQRILNSGGEYVGFWEGMWVEDALDNEIEFKKAIISQLEKQGVDESEIFYHAEYWWTVCRLEGGVLKVIERLIHIISNLAKDNAEKILKQNKDVIERIESEIKTLNKEKDNAISRFLSLPTGIEGVSEVLERENNERNERIKILEEELIEVRSEDELGELLDKLPLILRKTFEL